MNSVLSARNTSRQPKWPLPASLGVWRKITARSCSALPTSRARATAVPLVPPLPASDQAQ